MRNKNLPARTELDLLATKLVGDGKAPNFFFVSTSRDGEKSEVLTVTQDFALAWNQWRAIASGSPSLLPMLEDRQYGVIASVDREKEDGTGRLVVNDDSALFLKRREK